ncbi:F187A protein, partial [Amia calva]|nr:F187A protein [Amia calva]
MPSGLSAYEAIQEDEDIFARRPCPAFLMFDNAAYVSDMTIELPCHCKPEVVPSVVWYYQKQLGVKDTRVLTDFNGTKVVDSAQVGRGLDIRSRFSIRLFSLLIFQSQAADSGHYICGTSTGEFFYGYDVDIQEVGEVSFSLEPQSLGPPGDAGRMPHYRVFTSFWPWSVCDRCGIRGEQTRVGLCYLESPYLYSRYRLQPPGVASCGSASVPQRFKKHLREKRAELAVRSCITNCPPEPTLPPEEKSFLDFLGSRSDAPKLVVQYYSHPEGRPLVLACSGAQANKAVAWDKDQLRLYRAQYMEGVNKTARMYIDASQHLVFRDVQMNDGGTYYCWLQGKLAVEIRLSITRRFARKRKLSDPESVYAMKAILLSYTVFTVIFVLFLIVRLLWQYFIGREML